MNHHQASIWISSSRLTPFVAATNQHYELAISMYRWHARLSSAFFETIHHFEIFIRNTIDLNLGENQPNLPIDCTWLLDDHVLRPSEMGRVRRSIRTLDQTSQVSRSRVIAALPFGFWRCLLGGQYEELWRHKLRFGFPGARRRKDVSYSIDQVAQLRNRVAHHECLLRLDLEALYSQMLMIAGYVSIEAADWLEDWSDVVKILNQRPCCNYKLSCI